MSDAVPGAYPEEFQERVKALCPYPGWYDYLRYGEIDLQRVLLKEGSSMAGSPDDVVELFARGRETDILADAVRRQQVYKLAIEAGELHFEAKKNLEAEKAPKATSGG